MEGSSSNYPNRLNIWKEIQAFPVHKVYSERNVNFKVNCTIAELYIELPLIF